MSRAEKGQRVLDACLKAQGAGTAIDGIYDMMLWTGMSHQQVWDGINYLRDYATKMGSDLISCTRKPGSLTRVYRVGDEAGCREWSIDRMKYIATAARRAVQIMTAVSNVTGRSEDIKAARRIEKAFIEVDRAIADLIAAT
jgi:hypothetical protein